MLAVITVALIKIGLVIAGLMTAAAYHIDKRRLLDCSNCHR